MQIDMEKIQKQEEETRALEEKRKREEELRAQLELEEQRKRKEVDRAEQEWYWDVTRRGLLQAERRNAVLNEQRMREEVDQAARGRARDVEQRGVRIHRAKHIQSNLLNHKSQSELQTKLDDAVRRGETELVEVASNSGEMEEEDLQETFTCIIRIVHVPSVQERHDRAEQEGRVIDVDGPPSPDRKPEGVPLSPISGGQRHPGFRFPEWSP